VLPATGRSQPNTTEVGETQILIDISPVNTSTTVTATEACPYCRTSARTRQTSYTGRVRAWSCDHCDTDWAYTVPDTRAAVRPTTGHGAVAQEIRRLRWALAQVVTLADEMPKLTDVELRNRLLTLTESGAR
jgi:ribosomal protein L37AE/L43A